MVRRSLAYVLGVALVALSLGGSARAATPACVGTPGTSTYTCDNFGGSVSVTTLGTVYTQDFSSLAITGTSTNLPAGWSIKETGTATAVNGSYSAGTGSGTAGDVYSFGSSAAPANADRALGDLLSGSNTPLFGAGFMNNSGAPATHIDIAYAGEQWRFGQASRGSDRLDFEYSLNATSLTSGTWSAFDALDFTAPNSPLAAGALDGNLPLNRTALSATIVGVVPAGGAVWIRWTDFNITGSDDGLAVDDFTLRLRSEEVGPSVASTTPANGSEGVAVAATVTVSFSEPVAVSGAWYSISCATSGGHTATVSGGSQTYTLDPDANFAAAEECTVIIYAENVTDLDTADPPDNMAANYQWSFTTIDNSVCGDPATLIHAVQGTGLASPMLGSKVTIEGVVIGDYQGSGGFSGFYVQEQDSDADADPATSEGISIFSTAVNVAVGDVVRVRGTVNEFGSGSSTLTELINVTRTLICSTGSSVTATSVDLPVASLADFERYEGMSVTFADTLTVTETFNLGRFGEVRLSEGGRLYVPSTQTAPTNAADYAAAEDANNRRSFILDDGNNQQNIDPTINPAGGLSASNSLRSGYSVSGLSGVFDQRFGSYRLQPVAPVSFSATNPRTTAPEPVDGNIRVASFNVLNFFNGNGTHQAGAAGGFPTARGANTLTEFQRQLAKEVSALTAMDADIVGLMEIENDAENGEVTAIADLVSALNGAMGAGTYAYINTSRIGTDEIKVALIYKPGSVTPVGPWQIITSATDPRFIDTKSRPSLAQTFERNATGERLTVVVNHLKSKGSGCDDVGDPDTGDGQGSCNGTREMAAQAIADWLGTDPTGSGDPDFLLIGDMNSYTFEDPIAAFEASGFVNMIRQLHGLDAYSYVFNGEAGYLDHALATGSLASQITGAVDWHINSDEPTVLDYNTEFKTANQVNTFYDSGPYRASDHDPVVIGIRLVATERGLCALTRELVTSRGVATSLCAKLDAAASAGARGNVTARAGQLRSFVNEVEAQRGKAISDADAVTLLAIAARM